MNPSSLSMGLSFVFVICVFSLDAIPRTLLLLMPRSSFRKGETPLRNGLASPPTATQYTSFRFKEKVEDEKQDLPVVVIQQPLEESSFAWEEEWNALG